MAVRSSKYRHVYGDPTRKDKCIDNIRLTKNAFDANLVKSNGKYVSVNWEASGGGSFAVVPVAEQGKLPDRFPLFDGHKGPVLDTDWNPFDDEMVVSASDDGTIGIWKVPEDFTVHKDFVGNLDACKDIEPVKFLTGHGKKVGHVGFNPVAENVLASTSLDNTVKVWDIESGEVLFTLQHPAFVTSFSWNYDGTKMATVAKDRKLRIWDVRKEKVLTEGKGHHGAKGSRVIWLGDSERVLTTGFSLVSDREMALWDANDVAKGPIGGFRGLDPSSGIVIPHYDPMTSVVYLGGRGDGKIVYYEFADDTLYDLFAFNSTSPQRGLGWAPNRSLDPRAHEVARVYKVHEGTVEPISFKIPLKNDGFLDSVYTVCDSTKPALSAKEWTSGKTARPLVKQWKDVYEGKAVEPKEAPDYATKSSSAAETTTPPPKATKTNTKTEPKTETKAKKESEADSKKEPETESKKELKTEPKSESTSSSRTAASASEVSALKKAEKQDSYDVLHSDKVKSFLAKNMQDAPEEESEPDSEWTEVEKPEKETPKKETSKKEEPKKEEPKKEEPKKEEPKKEEPKKEEPKKEEPKKEEPKKEEPKKEEPKKEDPKKEEPKKEASKKEEPKKEEPNEGEKKDSKKEVKVVVSPENESVVSISTSEESKLDLILKKLDDLSARVEKLERK